MYKYRAETARSLHIFIDLYLANLMEETLVKHLAMIILWPAFMVATVAEGAFFSMFDPHELTYNFAHLELPASATYTLGFFFFWFLAAAAGMLTHLLETSPKHQSHS